MLMHADSFAKKLKAHHQTKINLTERQRNV